MYVKLCYFSYSVSSQWNQQQYNCQFQLEIQVTVCFTNRKGASQEWHDKTKWFSSWFCLIILHENKQGKSEGLDSCDQPNNLTQTWFKSLIFQPIWPRNVMDDLEKQ